MHLQKQCITFTTRLEIRILLYMFFKGTVVINVEWEGKKGGVKAIFDWPEGGGGRGEGGLFNFLERSF